MMPDTGAANTVNSQERLQYASLGNAADTVLDRWAHVVQAYLLSTLSEVRANPRCKSCVTYLYLLTIMPLRSIQNWSVSGWGASIVSNTADRLNAKRHVSVLFSGGSINVIKDLEDGHFCIVVFPACWLECVDSTWALILQLLDYFRHRAQIRDRTVVDWLRWIQKNCLSWAMEWLPSARTEPGDSWSHQSRL